MLMDRALELLLRIGRKHDFVLSIVAEFFEDTFEAWHAGMWQRPDSLAKLIFQEKASFSVAAH